MKKLLVILFILLFSFTGSTQSPLQQRLEFLRLSLENKYGWVGNFDSLTGIATVYDKGYMGYIDTNSRIVLPLAYSTRDFSDGLGIYHDPSTKSIKVIDKKARLIKEFKNLSSLLGFKKGLSIFSTPSAAGLLYGVMDLKGNIIIKNQYPYIEKIAEKYYYVNSNKVGAGVINAAGDTVIPVSYIIYYTDTTDLHFIGYRPDAGYGSFASSGKMIKYLGKEFYPETNHIEGIPHFQRDSVFILKNQFLSAGSKMALVNLDLDTIVPMGKYKLTAINEGMVCYYDSVPSGNKARDSLVAKCGFLNTKGAIVIPARYDFAIYFTEGLCSVQENKKWGYINKEGKLVIPFQFDYALPFHMGYAKVKVKDDFFIIDRKGKIVMKSKSY